MGHTRVGWVLETAPKPPPLVSRWFMTAIPKKSKYLVLIYNRGSQKYNKGQITAQKTGGSFMKPAHSVGLWNNWNIWSLDSGFFFFFFQLCGAGGSLIWTKKKPRNWWLLTHQIPIQHSQHWCEAVLGGYHNFMIPARSGFHKIIYKGSRFHFFFS